MEITLKDKNGVLLYTEKKYCKENIQIIPETENIEINPSTEEQVFISEKVGYSEVKIKGVTSEIDENIKPENIKVGTTILGIEGGYEGIDTSDATATASDILKDKTAYVNGEKIVGTLEQSSDSSNYNATLSNDNNEPMTVKGWLTEVSSVDLTGVTSMKNAFDGCSTLKKIGNLLNTGDVTDTSYCFRYCYYLEVVPTFDTSNVTITTSMFNACTMLENVPLLDMSSVTRVSSMFDSCPSLKNLGGFKNLGKSYNQQSSGHQYLTLDLDVASGLTHESLMNVINNLYDLNLTYDVANGGTLYTQKLQIGATNLAKLTAEEIRNSDSKADGRLVNNKKEEIIMKFFNYTKPKMIVADEGKQIREKNDVYVPEHTDEEGNIVPEHFPYYTTTIFTPDSYTEEQMNQDYIEENI